MLLLLRLLLLLLMPLASAFLNWFNEKRSVTHESHVIEKKQLLKQSRICGLPWFCRGAWIDLVATCGHFQPFEEADGSVPMPAGMQ
mmetsp:Transcript_23536/g.45721  ORF Transcript_23536/g.45721 Transcript_23536/m.45721 type:complete len:86 (+) Transcript_23536:192-449(+)